MVGVKSAGHRRFWVGDKGSPGRPVGVLLVSCPVLPRIGCSLPHR
ncbi:hypothetical protein FGG22_gp010 [Mycobacterium phage Hammer]|uniref:Uncharacterized protein n=1 Tax=Mycobacterium phage Hammer TaxID=2922204 RepID=G1D1V2_9CAUD|nr:hypothetical protein FGG22_gp010 [Mycobacterium phage Hammer]AEK08753.1 hypothetical protein HAMMER_106 [Mycobacterium phage Hammer]